LAELAALPPEQRAAIAALLTPCTPEQREKPSDLADDRLPWEREQKEGDTNWSPTWNALLASTKARTWAGSFGTSPRAAWRLMGC